MNPDLIVLSLSAIFNAILSGFIVLRNPKGRLNQAFGLFGLVIVLWTIANFAADQAATQNLLYTRLTLFLGACLGVSLFMLCALFPDRKPWRRSWFGFVGLSAAAMGLSFTPLFVSAVTRTAHGAELTVGVLYGLYDIYILTAIVWSVWILLRGSRPANRNEKSQVRLVAIGIITYAGLAFVSNGVLPLIVNNWTSSRFGPIFTVPFVAILFYAIIKHHLFDMRLALTRTVGFVVTIGIISAIYSLLILVVGAPIISGGRIRLATDDPQLLLLLAPTIVAILTFQSLQRFITRITKGIFYQDSYDTRDTLDRLSDALLSDNNIEAIMRGGLAVMSGVLKPAQALFIALDDQGGVYRELPVNRAGAEDPQALLHAARQLKGRVEIKDNISPLRWPSVFDREGIALVLTLGAAKHQAGVLFLGPKQNGRIYSRQDAQLLSVGAKNFGVAIENAKKYEQIARFADTMHHEVRRATARLRKANAELKTLDALKDDFISMASHQLRSPATSIHEAIQMLGQNYLNDENRKQLIELAGASSERLVNVITDMLSVARIQAGRFELVRTHLNLVELAERAILEASANAAQKNIAVRFDKPSGAVMVNADRAKINEAIANYLENAVKYSGEGQTVKIAVDMRPDGAHLEVSDQGIGVPKSEHGDLFGKFFRASNARKIYPNGNGVGLFVVKTIAEAHGGQAYFRPLEHGSLFGFTLPR